MSHPDLGWALGLAYVLDDLVRKAKRDEREAIVAMIQDYAKGCHDNPALSACDAVCDRIRERGQP